jgi:hypothetical protein
VPKVSWDEVRRRERADTIEHILPQTPKDAYWRDRFDKSNQKLFVHHARPQSVSDRPGVEP